MAEHLHVGRRALVPKLESLVTAVSLFMFIPLASLALICSLQSVGCSLEVLLFPRDFENVDADAMIPLGASNQWQDLYGQCASGESDNYSTSIHISTQDHRHDVL